MKEAPLQNLEVWSLRGLLQLINKLLYYSLKWHCEFSLQVTRTKLRK